MALRREIVRYLVAGGLAFVVDVAIFQAALVLFDMHYLVANVGGYFGGLLIAYHLNTRWVFSYRRIQRGWLEITLFCALLLVGLALSQGVLMLLVEVVGAPPLAAKVVAGFFLMLFNFVARKMLLFSPARATRAAKP